MYDPELTAEEVYEFVFGTMIGKALERWPDIDDAQAGEIADFAITNADLILSLAYNRLFLGEKLQS